MKNIKMVPDAFREFQKIVERVNKYLLKNEKEPIRFENIHRVFESMKRSRTSHTYVYEFIVFDLEGDYNKLDGYTVVAIIDHYSRKVLTDEKNLNFKRFIDREICDHCKKKIQRRATHILKNESTGELLQIGSTCLNSFFEKISGKEIIKIIEELSGTISYLDEQQKYGSEIRMVPHVPIESAIDKANLLISQFGFNSTYSKAPTSELLKGWCFHRVSIRRNMFPDRNILKRTPENVSKLVKEFMLSSTTLENHEVYKNLIEKGFVDEYQMGYVAMMVQMWRNHLGTKVETLDTFGKGSHDTEPRKFSFIPLNEKVMEEAVFVQRKHLIGGNGNPYFLYVFTNEKHHFCSFSQKEFQLTIGETYTIKGTVNKNTTYKGINQTGLIRLEIL